MLAGSQIRKARMLAIASTVLAASLFTASVFSLSPTAGATTVSELQQQQAELDKKEEENNAKLESLKEDTAKQQEYYDTLTSQMETLNSQISVLNAQITELDAQITEKEAAIEETQAKIDGNFDLLKKRLRALYMTGEASTLEIILSADSIADLAEKAEILRAITAHDTELINSLKTDMDSIAQQKQEIEENRTTVAQAKTELDQKYSEVNSLAAETESVLKDLNAQKISVENDQQEIAGQREAMDAEIERLLQEAQQNNNSGNAGGSGGDTGGTVGTGQLLWPVPGYGTSYITSVFGNRWGMLHGAIDIGVPHGTNIVAADDGVVIASYNGCPHDYGKNGSCGCGGGFGNYVMVDHRNGFVTIYGHMWQTAVSSGATVQKGQLLGYVGSTGWSTGNHLHFEVRLNGQKVDPMDYL